MTGTSTNHMTAISGSGISGIAVGMAVTGTNVTAGSVVALLVSQTALDLSIATGGAPSAVVFTGDVFKISLIKVTPTGTYDQTLVNAGTPGTGTCTTTNIGTDELANGSGYTTGGLTLTNVLAVLSSTTAVGSFSGTIQWTSATFSTVAGVIYNNSYRLGAATNGISPNAGGATAINHTLSVHDFGGTQTVSSGTFTLVVPTANSSTGLLRIA
jgi:hypothetical protein